jgi:tRNA 2-thiouridine synthesizing protein D
MSKTLTIAILDAPCESANTATAFRILEAALQKGMNVNVFAREGVLSRDRMDALQHLAREKGAAFDWRSDGPSADLLKSLPSSANTLVVPTR